MATAPDHPTSPPSTRIAGTPTARDLEPATCSRRLGVRATSRPNGVFAIGRDPSEITRSVLLDFNPQLSPSTAHELADVVGRLNDIGFEECIAYAWLDGVVARSTDEPLSFVVDDLSKLRDGLG